MKLCTTLLALSASAGLAALLALSERSVAPTHPLTPTPDSPSSWRTDPIWHDGLVEKATYTASKVIYGQPRPYTAIFFTNKEQHDTKTWTKSSTSKSTLEVFKHNQIEAVPTPNYTYHFVTTSHFSVEGLKLTRYDQSSQEFCGTSFRQLIADGDTPGRNYNLQAFSYMPEAGRLSAELKPRRLVPEDSLPIYLRDFPFSPNNSWNLDLLPTQRSNRQAPSATVSATVRYAGRNEGDHIVELLVDGKLRGTYHFAPDRQHVMTRYRSADGSQSYDLDTQERTDYWTIQPGK